MPEISAGDLVLFPSYLLHEVPANQGEQRISIAFNAIPERLENFGYGIGREHGRHRCEGHDRVRAEDVCHPGGSEASRRRASDRAGLA